MFVLATPREWFHDQPRAASVVLMSSLHGSNRVFISTELLEDVPEAQRSARAQALIRQHVGKTWRVVRVEPIQDPAQEEIKGFLAYTNP